MSLSIGRKIGAVARELGLQPSAVRFYERHGLLASGRLANGYRIYDREALCFIVRAKELGFTLGQIREALYWSAVQTMPFARPHFRELLSAVDFVVAKDYPARGEVP